MKKAWNVTKNIIVWLIVLGTVGMMAFTIFAVNTFDRSNRSVFGYKFFIVQSDSMSATDFSAGDIVFVKTVDPATLREGDIIAYTSQNSSNFGETVTHKIRSITQTASGERGFITYGTTTGIDDETVVTDLYVLGKYVGNLPKVGKFFAFMKTTQGYIVCILIPFLLLIGYSGLNCIQLFVHYKNQQMEELRQERKRLAEQRRQSEQMLKEIEDLRAWLIENGGMTEKLDRLTKS